jgi:hypothetical protein
MPAELAWKDNEGRMSLCWPEAEWRCGGETESRRVVCGIEAWLANIHQLEVLSIVCELPVEASFPLLETPCRIIGLAQAEGQATSWT